MLTEKQMTLLETNQVSREIITDVLGNDEYYLKPLDYIKNELHLKLTCTAQEYRLAVEMANDEDVCPQDADIKVIVDGILAYIFADALEATGIDLVGYITYRFHPPTPEFQEKLDQFEKLIQAEVIPQYASFTITLKSDERFELKGTVNLNTIDDTDGGDWEYEQNDGLWDTHIPTYLKISGEDLSDEWNYKFLPLIDWDFIRQFIVDAEDGGDGIEHNGLIIGVEK